MKSSTFKHSEFSLEWLKERMPELTELERAAIGAIVDVAKHCYSVATPDTAWTVKVKEELAKLAFQLSDNPNGGPKYLPFPNQMCGRFTAQDRWKYGGEWIFDVVWVECIGDFDWRKPIGLKLACESEWLSSEYDILTDFLKLAFCVAEVRLFVYTNRTVETDDGSNPHPAELCFKHCPTGRDFRYITIGLPPNKGDESQIDFWVK